MIVLFLTFATIGGVAAGLIYGPRYYEKHKKEQLLLLIEREGTPEQRKRAKEIKQRELDIKLKMLEVEQVKRVFNTPGS